MVAAFALAVLVAGCQLPTGPGTRVVESSVHTLVGRSLPGEGLRRNDKFLSIDNQPGELIWLTGASLETVAGENVPRPVLSRASVVLLHAVRYLQLHGLIQNPQGMLFRFSPGARKVTLPEGFGIPVNSNEPIILGTESQCDEELPKPETATFRLSLDFVRQRGLEEPMKPPYCVQLSGLISAEETPGYFGVKDPDPKIHGTGAPVLAPATEQRLTDSNGHAFADTWYVDPGEQVVRTLSTQVMAVQRTTRLHLATGHMSDNGVSLELYDLTDGRSVISLERNAEGPGLQEYKSVEGVELHRDHQYELVARYFNQSRVPQKASAQMMLYVLAPEFDLEKQR